MRASAQHRRLSDLADLAGEKAEILAGIIAASSDACWCMEFGEPIDLTAPDREVVRQVFENDPYWRFTNPAMARLYLLDPTVDFSTCPTADIFPRNRQNEAFVRKLIENGFEMDAVPALDTRYDGVQIYVENDVRAHIEGGCLLRMFGIVRDVGKHRIREERMQEQLNEALDILTTLPCGVLAFDSYAEVVAANPMACTLLDRTVDDLLGGCLAQDAAYDRLRQVISAVASGGAPDRLVLGDITWSIVPRTGGGAVASLTAETQRGRQP